MAILLAVLVAFSWQSFLAQTHEHFGTARHAAIAAPVDFAASPAPGDRKTPSGLPDNCWICRAVAHSDHLLLPKMLEADVPRATAFWFAPASPPGAALAQPSHTWRSRAPPSQLQA